MIRARVALCFLAAWTMSAQTEYFPLQTGNLWIYRAGAATRNIEVGPEKAIDDHRYYQVTGMPEDALVRFTDSGTLVAYEEGKETEWARFGAPEGVTYETGMGRCQQQATITSRAARYSGPIGGFNNALEIIYSGGVCADAGLQRDVYLPWVGLVERTETTFAGPRKYELVYARLGGVTVISAPEVGFGLTLDQSVYAPGSVMVARISLRHSHPEPLALTFSSGQTYDITIRNEAGDVVYRWSKRKAFTQVLRTVNFPAGEKNWTESIPVDFPPGKYTARAWLVTTGGKDYLASVGFEVRQKEE